LITASELLRSLLAGSFAGLASGLLGVSPGGFLVPIISLLLPFSQHAAQGISLIVQAPPTSLAGLSIYSKNGYRIAVRPVVLASIGFILGGPAGAYLARLCTDRELRWMFVGYLLLLAGLATVKKSKAATNVARTDQTPQSSSLALLVIGVIAGISSGLLGIGGGLAVTALSVVLLHKEQHQAQAFSLAITMLPLTLPAAWVYAGQGWHLPWAVIIFLLAGLTLGTRVGAVFANRLSERQLKIAFVVLLAILAIYMGVIASRGSHPG
jgi:uncharacterized protein